MKATPGSITWRKRAARKAKRRAKAELTALRRLAQKGVVDVVVLLDTLADKPKQRRVLAKGMAAKSSASFYRTDTWKRLRYDALTASDGRCQCCGASAADGATLRVDHIQAISVAPHRKADPSNLQVLCNDCNWGKGNRDSTDWRSGTLHLVASNGRSVK